VQSLSPNTTYYFRVRGGNGCATGPWSNEISVKTKGLVAFNQLAKTQSELIPESIEETPEILEQTGYNVKIKVVDANGKPVEGAKVTLHSKVREPLTNQDGIVEFKNVEPGEHKVIITYGNYQGEQSVYLSGDEKEFDLNITIQQEAISPSSLRYGIIGVMGVIIIVSIVLLIKVKRQKLE
jgi:hypothetical protein